MEARSPQRSKPDAATMVPDRPPNLWTTSKRRTADTQSNAPLTPDKLLTAPGGTTPTVSTPTSDMALDGTAPEQHEAAPTNDQQPGPR